MKGIVLAGGKGTRLHPATLTMNKHMVPLLNTPMILYPLETLRHVGITDVLIVTGGEHIGAIAEFLEDGSGYGVRLTYRVQKEAGGIAQALGLAKDFVGDEGAVVILGDNIFDNTALPEVLPEGAGSTKAMVFFSPVKNPSRFGVPVFQNGALVAIEEKPAEPKSALALTGLYVVPSDVFTLIPTLRPSARGELEIADVLNWYIAANRCLHQELTGFWSDAGTPASLKEAIDWTYGRGQ